MKTVFLILYFMTVGGDVGVHIEKVESQFVCEHLGKASVDIRKSPAANLRYSTYRCLAFPSTTANTSVGGGIER